MSDIWLAGYDGINPTLALSSLTSSAVTNRYLWGPGVDFLLADEQLAPPANPSAPVSAGNTLWPLGDQLGTLRDLADFTGSSFAITNHRVFDTFGRLTSESNSAVDTNFAFTGKFFEDLGDTDNSTSLSHHWNRWYDPQLGKWLSEDPIGFAGGDANLGRYVGNHPVGGRDLNGLDVVWAVQISPSNPATQIGGIDASSRLRPEISSRLQVVEKIQGDDTIGLGVLVPPGVEGKKATVAYPPPRESGSTSGFGRFLDWVQGSLDAGGTVEPTPFCDIANTGICIARGKWVDAGLTILGVIPYFGDAGKAVKHGRKLVEGASEVADTVNDLSKTADLGKSVDLVSDLKNVPELSRAADGAVQFKKWKRGEPIDKPMPDGTAPSWQIVQSRYWKNRYEASKGSDEFSKTQLAEMRKGNAPMDYNPRTGRWERRELHNVDPQRHKKDNSPLNIRELKPDWHAEVDPFRKIPGVQPSRGIR